MKTVFFDVDTQLDFLCPAGALYVPGGEKLLPALGALTRCAGARKIQIISTADAHTENDPEFQAWKPHCVVGTVGQQKAAATLLPNARVLGTGSDPSAPQLIVEKQKLDAFSNPNLGPLLKAMAADRYVLYGVVTELCVRCAAIGLLETGARVELVTDAIKSLSTGDERAFIEQFQGQRGVLTAAAAVLNE
ncbi:MAG: cysteine hydrolase [Acidobacteriaceae bacterium]|nr:cysteine hydrolase [Acidobacteriaceae bacterium]